MAAKGKEVMNCNHDWYRTNGAVTDDGCDTFRCTKCHITGKSFGLGGVIVPDTKGNKPKNINGITFRRGRGPSLETILREAKKRGSGLEWSKLEYEKRLAAEQSQDDEVE